MKRIFKPDIIFFAIGTLLLWIVLTIFLGINLFEHSPIDQHTRQALAWKKGEIHLEEDFSWLELAKYKGKIYVSFPVSPTLIAFPMVLIFGQNTPNTLTLLIFTWVAMLFSFFILEKLTKNRPLSFLMSFSFFWGSQILYLSMRGAVWHQGQLYGVFFTITAFLIALYSKRAIYLIFSGLMLALAVGCRPFYLFMAPLLLYLSLQKHSPLKTILFTGIGLASFGTFLALYNFIRFDSIFEFGHNYLPLTTIQGYPQFGLRYLLRNLKHVFIKLPQWVPSRNLLTFYGEGTAIWMVAPVILLGFYFFFKRDVPLCEKIIGGSSLAAIWLMLLFHVSNGWFQFGYRYGVDLIPLSLYFFGRSFKKLKFWFVPICAFSVIINIYGAFWFYLFRYSL